MRKIFQLEMKIGWGELLSLVAIIVSVRGCINEAPRVTVTPLRPRAIWSCSNESGEWQILALLQFRLANNGERMTSLVGVQQSGSVSPVLGVAADSSLPTSFSATLFSPASTGHIPNIVTPLDIEKLPRRTLLSSERDSNSLIVVEGKLPTGESVPLTLGFMVDLSPKERRFDFFSLGLDFELVHGKRIPVQAEIEVPFPPPSGQCPDEMGSGS